MNPRPISSDLFTVCSHAGCSSPISAEQNSPVVAPIYQSTTFALGTAADAEAIFSGERKGYSYSRFGNPSVDALAQAITQLEGGAGALVTSSGNAAILCAVTCAMEGQKGPLVTHNDIYGGSAELLRVLSTMYRVPVEVADAASAELWLDSVSRAGAVLLETPSNPLMRLIDIRATVECAHAAGAPVIVDNTVATPFNQRPLDLGADWTVHSTSKFL